MKVLRSILGVILGYAAMVLLITLVQEVWFGGVGWNKSSYTVLFLAGLFTFLSAVAGGMLAMIISGSVSKIPAILMACIVFLETIVIVATGRVAGPLWFDFSGSASLVVGVFLGWLIVRGFTGTECDSVQVQV